LTHLEATPINLNQISYGGRKKEKKEKWCNESNDLRIMIIKKFPSEIFSNDNHTSVVCGYPDTSVRTGGSESGYQESHPTESKSKQVNVNYTWKLLCLSKAILSLYARSGIF
jgi:hypothetical protein